MSSAQYLISDSLRARIEPLVPIYKTNPLGTHRKRVGNRDAMNGILFILTTDCQWNALNATGICTSSSSRSRWVSVHRDYGEPCNLVAKLRFNNAHWSI